MNSLPRFVAMALFTVLLALAGLLAVPLWHDSGVDPAAKPSAGGEPVPNVARARALSQRIALGLAAGALALAVALIMLQTFRPGRDAEARATFTAARAEVGTLAKLAETSVAQGVELSRERDVRRRAEDDARLKQQLLAQALDEKIRLGRDLHDGIIQSLYATGLNVETVRALVKSNPDDAERRLEEMRSGLNTTIRDVRAYIVGLAPENLRRAGFVQALTTAITELNAGRSARLDLAIDEAAAALLQPAQTIEALQIAREAVSNALRHGHASTVTLRLSSNNGELTLLIEDNGAGFDSMRASSGHGLGNMRARAATLGAVLRITSEPGRGTRVLATLPIIGPTSAA